MTRTAWPLELVERTEPVRGRGTGEGGKGGRGFESTGKINLTSRHSVRCGGCAVLGEND